MEPENQEDKVEKEAEQGVPEIEEAPEEPKEPKEPEEPEEQTGSDDQPQVPEAPETPDDNESRPVVVRGEPGSLTSKQKTAGRPKRSAVLVVRLKQLKDPGFLASGKGYKKDAAKRLVVELGDASAEETSQPDEQADPRVVVLSRYNGSRAA